MQESFDATVRQNGLLRHFSPGLTTLAASAAAVGISITTLAQSDSAVAPPPPPAAVSGDTGTAELQPAVFANYQSVIDEDVIVAADRLSDAFRRVADLVEPSVVRITGFNARGQVTGSGFVFRPDGYLVTNNHVIEPADRIYVEFVDGRRYAADVVGSDPLTDLAVLSIEASDLNALRFTMENELEVGDWVVAAGCPLGLQQTVTAGIVSATGRRLGIIGSGGRPGYEDFIQTDAAINRGNSGGPLLNLHGEVIGVNSAILTQTGGSDGLGFAIPSSLASQIVGDLMRNGRVERGLLGVNIQDLSPELAVSYGLPETQRGVLVTGIDPDLPAGKVGLQEEDVIVAIEGDRVTDADNLRKVVALNKPGSTVRVDILRGKLAISYDVELAALRDTFDEEPVRVRNRRNIGLGVEISNARTNRSGEVVAYIEGLIPGGIADLAGFEKGDIIVEVNGEELDRLAARRSTRPADFIEELLDDSPSDTVIRFKVQRPAGRGFLTNYVGLRIP